MNTARFVELTPPRRIVEAITFDSVDPAFSGEMIMVVTLEAEDDIAQNRSKNA